MGMFTRSRRGRRWGWRRTPEWETLWPRINELAEAIRAEDPERVRLLMRAIPRRDMHPMVFLATAALSQSRLFEVDPPIPPPVGGYL